MLSARHCHISLLVLFAFWQGGLTIPLLCKEPLTEMLSNETLTKMCVIYAKALSDNITDALTQDNQNLFQGIDCTKQNVELNTETGTPFDCAPHGASCSGVYKSQFNQKQCVCSIGNDLQYYYTFLSAHPDPESFLSSTILLKLRHLMTNCFPSALPEGVNESHSDRPSSYNERQSLCKKLKGFQVRSITINRALGYMMSGEQTK